MDNVCNDFYLERKAWELAKQQKSEDDVMVVWIENGIWSYGDLCRGGDWGYDTDYYVLEGIFSK